MKAKAALRHVLTIAGTSLLAISSTHAASLTWDNGDATGFWNTSDANWTTATWSNATPDDAVFGPTGVGTVTLTEAIAAGSLTFDTAGYTIDTSTFGLTLNTGITANQNATIQSGVGGSLILGADNLWSVASGRTLTVSSIISGASFGITKSGAGTLTLSGPNTYTGDTTLNGGTVVISNATSLGASDVLVTGNSRINAAALTYANDINIDASRVLTLGTTGATNSVSTFSGAVTGSGSIALAQGVNQGTVINLSSTSNTFTGDIIMPTAAGTNDFIRFASIGDGGSIIYGRASWLAQARYTGAADIVWNTRTISLATTIGIPSGLDGGGNPSHLFENTGAGTVTINTAMGVTSTASSTIFFLGGTNTGNNTFAGAIADPTGANTLGIGKAGTGKWILSNNTNSYQGPVVIHDGTLSVDNIDVAANAQPLGQGSLIQFGYRTANTGTLEYTGAANATTDKQIQVGQADRANNGNFRGGGIILNNGDGTLTFSNATFNSIAGMSATGTGHVRNITLGGTNTGANTISGTIRNNNTTIGALVSLTKTGAGTWILNGDNTYTGDTAVSQGRLLINGDSALATGNVTVANTATIGGGGTIGGNVTLSNGGKFAPGTINTIDNLTVGTSVVNKNFTWTAGASGEFQLGTSNASDRLDVFGNFTKSGTGTFVFDFLNSSSIGTFTLATWTGTSNFDAADFSFINYAPGGSFSITSASNGSLIFTAIPEPSTALAGLLLGLGLLRRRRA